MMAAYRSPVPLVERLPAIRGRITADAPLAGITWFNVGGPAEVMVRPVDQDDLAALLAGLASDIPVTVLGVGSNLLVRDGGIPGVVIRLGRGFAGIEAKGEYLTAGAAALDFNVASVAAEAGIAGLEFLTGVPGTIGGALKMNAGAYGGEMKDVVESAIAVDRSGALQTLSLADLGFEYRRSNVADGLIFTGTTLKGSAGDPATIARRLGEIRTSREESQPIRARTGGSTFKNPAGAKAWELIDKAGCRGLTLGAAQVSPKHTNFLINLGGATAADIEALGEEVRRRVLETSGIELHWEIKRVGVTEETAS